MQTGKNEIGNRDGSFIRLDEGNASVLVIDSDPLGLIATGAALNEHGYQTVLARTEAEAAASIESGQFDAIVLSIDNLQQGCDFAERLSSTDSNRDTPVIFLVPELSASWRPKLAHGGGVFCILRPFEPDSLIELIDKVLWLPHIAKGRLGSRPMLISRQKDWISLSGS